MPKNVLIVDDDKSWRNILNRGFNRQGAVPDVASSYTEAVELAKSKHYDLCVLDSLEGGYAPLRKELLSLIPDSRIVLFTGNGITYRDAVSDGIESYHKPGELDKLFELAK